MMNQDWQETLLTQKRIPHRLSKSQSKAATFDVRKLFGRHQLTYLSVQGPTSSSKKKSNEASLELYRLSDDGQGVLGEIHVPGILTCEVVLSGSRKSLAGVISSLEATKCSSSAEEKENRDGGSDKDERGAGDHSEEDEAEDESEHIDNGNCMKNDTSRPTFEKNSFRNPKFWLQFKSPTNPSDLGVGYLVFSGNDCRRFKGTLSSEAREWDNIAISGWKAVGMSERDVPFHWGQDAEASQDEEEGGFESFIISH